MLVRNETGEKFDRCLFVTGSDLFVLNLEQNGTLQEQKCFLHDISQEYENRQTKEGYRDQVERIDVASCHLNERFYQDNDS